jgi:DNA polymerase
MCPELGLKQVYKVSMPQSVPNAALNALTEWWEDMGVDVDHAEIKALILKPETVPVVEQPKITPIGKTIPVAPKPRNKSKTLEDWIAEATALAAAAPDLPALKAAIESFEGCELKKVCERTVVYDGTLNAPVMVLGEGPGGQEDRLGIPFVGKAGQLLDRMLAAIDLDRKTNTFISNVNFWRPPGNRNPDPDELAVCRPFVDRMVDIAQPKIIIAAGGVAVKSLLDSKQGIMKLRGKEQPFTTPAGTSVPMIPMLHPAYLLRRPEDKSRAWRDLLLVKARLDEMGIKT